MRCSHPLPLLSQRCTTFLTCSYATAGVRPRRHAAGSVRSSITMLSERGFVWAWIRMEESGGAMSLRALCPLHGARRSTPWAVRACWTSHPLRLLTCCQTTCTPPPPRGAPAHRPHPNQLLPPAGRQRWRRGSRSAGRATSANSPRSAPFGCRATPQQAIQRDRRQRGGGARGGSGCSRRTGMTTPRRRRCGGTTINPEPCSEPWARTPKS